MFCKQGVFGKRTIEIDYCFSKLVSPRLFVNFGSRKNYKFQGTAVVQIVILYPRKEYSDLCVYITLPVHALYISTGPCTQGTQAGRDSRLECSDNILKLLVAESPILSRPPLT